MVDRPELRELIAAIIADETKDRPIETWLVLSRRLKIADRIIAEALKEPAS
jgi:hypothetical protein